MIWDFDRKKRVRAASNRYWGPAMDRPECEGCGTTTEPREIHHLEYIDPYWVLYRCTNWSLRNRYRLINLSVMFLCKSCHVIAHDGDFRNDMS